MSCPSRMSQYMQSSQRGFGMFLHCSEMGWLTKDATDGLLSFSCLSKGLLQMLHRGLYAKIRGCRGGAGACI